MKKNMIAATRSLVALIALVITLGLTSCAGEEIETLAAAIDPNPTVRSEVLVADTTMVYKVSETGKATAVMNHRLIKKTLWSNGEETADTIWNKSFQVAKVFLAASEGHIYSQTAACDLKFTYFPNLVKEKVNEDGAFVVTTRSGSLQFESYYVCDAGVEQKWDGGISAEEATVVVSYEGYSATYVFNLAANFIGQKEEDRGLEAESRTNSTYLYESTSVGSWNVTLNNALLGVHNVDIDVRHLAE